MTEKPVDLLGPNNLGDRVTIGWDLREDRLTGTIQLRNPDGSYVIEDDDGFGWLVRPEDVWSVGPA